MKNGKKLLTAALVVLVLGVAFYLFNYSQNGTVGTTSVLGANNSDEQTENSGEIITQNHFQQNSQDYTLILNDNGEVVER